MPDSGKVRELRIDIDAAFNWSVGAHMERFIRGLGERKLLGVRCPKCERVLVPPRKICERCFAETDEWVEVGPQAAVETFTIGYVKVDKAGGLKDLDEPQAYGLIKPDGADTSFVHRIVVADPVEVVDSMRVEAVWMDRPVGDLSDLEYFKPV